MYVISRAPIATRFPSVDMAAMTADGNRVAIGANDNEAMLVVSFGHVCPNESMT
jgi:hypothetical protein